MKNNLHCSKERSQNIQEHCNVVMQP